MKLDDLLQNVQSRWHQDFLRFIETGEAGDEFLDYLNHDKGGQQAVETAFNAQAAAFEGLAEELKKGPVEPATAPTVAASARMAEAVEAVLQLSPEQRREALLKTASVLQASLGPDQQNAAKSVVQGLEHAFAANQ